VAVILFINAGTTAFTAKCSGLKKFSSEVIMKIVIYIFLFSVFLIVTGCDTSNKPAFGPEDEIFVVADSTEYEELKTALENTFQKIIYTPQPEHLFILKRVPINQLERVQNKKNIIIVAPLNSGSVTSKFIDAVIDSQVKSSIFNEENHVILKNDLWAKNQLVMILTAPDLQELEFRILQNSDNLIYAFQKVSDKRLYQSLYNSRYEQKGIQGKLLKDYGWIIYVQADYKLALNKPENNFVWLRRSPGSDMERWIFVHWMENASPEYLNEDSIKAIRNRLTEKFYRTSDDTSYVRIAEDYYMTSEVNFKDRYALFTQGLWELNIKGMGGPFISYTFFDEKTKRLYMVDGSIYAPKYYKRNLIQQMDVTLQSFMTSEELSEDRIDDLLSSAEEE
jgi:hypothetical protein